MGFRALAGGWAGLAGQAEDRALPAPTVGAGTIPYSPYSEHPEFPAGADAAMRIADVFACVRCIADTAASLPLIAYRRTPAGRVRTTGRLASLLERPAPATTTANLIGTLLAHLTLHGNGFLGKYRNGDGTVAQIVPLDPTAVQVELDRGGEPVYVLYTEHGVTRHTSADIIHVRALSTDGLLGLSPIRQARQALGLATSLASHAHSFARNAGRPGGVLRIPGHRMQREQTADIQAHWQTLKAGGLNSGHLLIVGGPEDIQYQQLSLSMADAEFVAQRQLSTQEIARIFRIPAWMVGAPSGDSMTYSNVEGQALAFVKFSLSPWLALIEQALSADSDLAPSTVYCEFLLEGLLRGDSSSRAEFYSRALHPETGWMSRSEVRRAENLPAEGTQE